MGRVEPRSRVVVKSGLRGRKRKRLGHAYVGAVSPEVVELLEVDAARNDGEDQPKDLQDGDDEQTVVALQGLVHPEEPKHSGDDVHEDDSVREGVEHLVAPRGCESSHTCILRVSFKP